MKRLGGLWSQVTAWENLLLAAQKARRGKRSRPAVADFQLHLERELLSLRAALEDGSYRPGAYRLFTLYERKPRLIAAAPFRDRVVHHALLNVIEAPLDRRFIHDSYACRQGKGVHAAVERYQHFARRFDYVLKLDIASYFASIDHALLRAMLARRIKDARVLALAGTILEHGPPGPPSARFFADEDLVDLAGRRCGIPIGNLTSQFFANLYLDGFDHWVMETLKAPGYIRYVDDLFLFSSDRTALRHWQQQIATQLAALRLRYHPRKVELRRCTERVDVLGYQISRLRRWLRNDNGYRARRRFTRWAAHYAAGRLNWPDIHAGVRSWIGHACHAQTGGLRERLFSELLFQREQAEQ